MIQRNSLNLCQWLCAPISTAILFFGASAVSFAEPGQGLFDIPPASDSSAVPKGEDAATFGERLAAIRAGVCRVVVSDPLGNVLGNGSGFVISSDGFIVTNHHVIELAASAVVELPDQSLKLNAELWQTWPEFDLALLKVDLARAGAPDVALTALRLAAGEPALADDVWTLGFPLSTKLGLTVNKGIVSGLRSREELGSLVDHPDSQRKIIAFDSKIRFVQTDSQINPGNSGGPLIDSRGNVIGVNTLSLTGANSFFFAVSAQHVRSLFESRGSRAMTFAARQSAQRAAGVPVPVVRGTPDETPPPQPDSPPPDAFQLPNADSIFYAFRPPERRSTWQAANAAARDLEKVGMERCGRCVGKGEIRETRQVGSRSDGAMTYPVMQVFVRPCDRCGRSGKVPPKDVYIRNTAIRLANALGAVPLTQTAAADNGDPAAEVWSRLGQTAWDDLARWGELSAWCKNELQRSPVDVSRPIVLITRVVAVSPNGGPDGQRTIALSSPLPGLMLVTGSMHNVDFVAPGDRVLVVGVTGNQAEVENTRFVAIHGGCVLRR